MYCRYFYGLCLWGDESAAPYNTLGGPMPLHPVSADRPGAGPYKTNFLSSAVREGKGLRENHGWFSLKSHPRSG